MAKKKQPIIIAVPLNCNKQSCGSCQKTHWEDESRVCSVFGKALWSQGFSTYKRLPECKAAELLIKKEP